jgi:hypothetical protein
MVARSNTPLQSEAGYIDARPKTRSTKLLATHGRTIHVGHERSSQPCPLTVGLPPESGRIGAMPRAVDECRFCCRSRRGTGRSRPEGLSYIPGCRALPRERRLGRIGTDARDAYAAHTVGSGGGLATNLASRRRFWAMAASVNSSCAARGPRKRRRPSRRMRLR